MGRVNEANPEQRVTMEERWRRAREACDAGICDPAEKKFHRAGCMRKIRAEALVVQSETAVADPFYYDPHGLPDMSKYEEGRKKALRELAEGMDVPPEVRDMAAENWGDTPVTTKQPHSDDSAEIWGAPVDHTNARGWCAPSRCAVGVCLPEDPHDEDCPGPGSAYHKRFDTTGPLLELPEVRVRRGGLRWPVTRLSHSVSVTKDHWWSRRRYEVWTVVLGSATPSIHMGTFATRGEADEFSGNLDKLNLEINRRRDQIDDAAR